MRYLLFDRSKLTVYSILRKPENFRQFASATDDKGRTPLHYAVMGRFYSTSHVSDLVNVLLEIGPSINVADVYSKTPL